MITTIDETQGDVEGRIILANNSPLIKSAIFSRYLGATGRTLCEIGLAPPTSISHIARRAAGRSALVYQQEGACFSISVVSIVLGLQSAVRLDRLLEYRQS